MSTPGEGGEESKGQKIQKSNSPTPWRWGEWYHHVDLENEHTEGQTVWDGTWRSQLSIEDEKAPPERMTAGTGSDMPFGMPIPMPSPYGAHPKQPQNYKARTENTESNLGSKLAVPLSQEPSSTVSVLEIKRLCIKTLRGLKENWGLCVWLTPSCTMDKQLLFIC